MTIQYDGNCMSQMKVYEPVDRRRVNRASVVDDARSTLTHVEVRARIRVSETIGEFVLMKLCLKRVSVVERSGTRMA
jgi:hypothetical protein